MNLIARILKRRDAGHTTCAVVDLHGHEHGPGAVNHVVQTQGFRGIATEWLEISGTDAHAIVTTLLHRDLANSEEIMTLETASDLATQCFDLVAEPHAYFTNGEWTLNAESGSGGATLHSWDPSSDAAIDSGVVCLGENSAAL